MRNDINELKKNKATIHLEEGTCRKKIGVAKKREGELRKVAAKAVKKKEDAQIVKDFKEVACEEEQNFFFAELGVKKQETAALKAVQAKLRSLNWSGSVYKAIAKVSEGVTYLRGKYNIRSKLGRYMIRDGKKVSFAPSGKHNTAQTFHITLNKDDFSYHIHQEEDGKKGKHWYLSEDSNKVGFQLNPSRNASRWYVIYDPKSKSMFIRNSFSRNTLFVNPENKYTATTAFQSTDKRSLFLIDRPNYQALGCYKSKIGKDLDKYMGSYNKMTIEYCYHKCDQKTKGKFEYFGLTNGHQCACGDKFYRHPTDYQTDCGLVCKGHAGELCGGDKKYLIFRNTANKLKPVLVDKKPVSKDYTKGTKKTKNTKGL